MSHLSLLLLGSPMVECDGVAAQISYRKAIGLLAYLSLSGQSHGRDTLAALFWPEYDQARAYANLRRILAALKAVDRDWLDTDRDAVGLQRDGGLWVDVERFHACLTDCTTHGHGPDEVCTACVPPLAEAVQLYRDDFLAGFTLRDCPGFDEWQFFQTESLRRELVGALERLARYQGDQGQFDLAIQYARRWVSIDPLHEPAHCRLIELYAMAGQRSAALRQYQKCVELLEQDLGVAPQEQTTLLYTRLTSGAWDKTPVVPAVRSITPPVGPSGLSEVFNTLNASLQAPKSPARSHNLPARATPFLGREIELTQIARLLKSPDCRLLTVIGPGGVGKTRLALQAAAEALEDFAQGVCFVPLASLADAAFLVPAIAGALDFSLYSEEAARAQLIDALRYREILIVLDNFEHLLETAEFLVEILRDAPQVKLLVTSRERLNLQEEWVLPVEGLRVPSAEEMHGLGPDTPGPYSAVALFLQSARRARAGFVLSEANTGSVVRICRLLEGMPLGIELAAAWTNMLSCEEIAAEIERDLDFLSTPARNVPARHRSLRAAFDYSWGLLSLEERGLFGRLSIFRGGFGRGAAEAVAGASLRSLSSLSDKSFLRRNSAGRYEIPEALRSFGREALETEPSAGEEICTRHAVYYAAFLQQREAGLNGDGQQEALSEIEQEIENVRAAWDCGVGRRDRASIARALPSLYRFYCIRGWMQEGAAAFGRAIEALREEAPSEDALLGSLMARRGGCLYLLGLYEQAQPLLEASLSISRRLDDAPEVTFALNNLGNVSDMLGQYVRAEAFYQELLALCRALDDRHTTAVALSNLGNLAYKRGKYDRARQLHRQAIELCEAVGDRQGVAFSLNVLGDVAMYCGELDLAGQLQRQSLAVAGEIGDRQGVAFSQNSLGVLARSAGQYAEAGQLHQESLVIARDLDDRWGVAASLNHLGELARLTGDLPQALDALRAALRIARSIRALPQSLEILAGLAQVLLEQGERARAVELLLLVEAHPAAERRVVDRAARLLDDLGGEARADAALRSLEALWAELLN